MEIQILMLNEMSQAQKGKCHIAALIWNLKPLVSYNQAHKVVARGGHGNGRESLAGWISAYYTTVQVSSSRQR